ncbi:MAG: 50S ribosomal protein L9 [Candidatus Magasanikbacteria bacterium]
MAKKKIKVILLDNVPDLGSKYDVEEVAMGYFRNYLLPKGLAKPATEEALESLEEKKKKWEKQKQERVEELKKKVGQIESKTFSFEVKTGEEGQVYSSVSSADIKERLSEEGLVENVSVKIGNPIREIGEHEVKLNLGEGVNAYMSILIKPEDGSIEDYKEKEPSQDGSEEEEK